jgi:hypothetical protein
VVDFDRPEELDAQVRAALAFHGFESAVESTFFDAELVNERAEPGSRWEVSSPESVELWDRLAAYAALARS